MQLVCRAWIAVSPSLLAPSCGAILILLERGGHYCIVSVFVADVVRSQSSAMMGRELVLSTVKMNLNDRESDTSTCKAQDLSLMIYLCPCRMVGQKSTSRVDRVNSKDPLS